MPFRLVPIDEQPKTGTFRLVPVEEAPIEQEPVAPFAKGSLPDQAIQAIPDALVNNGIVRTMAGLGGGLLNRGTGVIQGAAEGMGEVADMLGYENLAKGAEGIAQNAGTVSKGINQTVEKLPMLGKGAAVIGDVAPVVALGPQSLVGGAIGEALTRPNEEPTGVTGRAIDAGINYAGGKVLNFVAQPIAKQIGKAFGVKAEQVTSDDLKQMANASYQKAEQTGGTLTKNVTNSFLDSAQNTLRPQTAAGKLVSGESVSTKLADRLEGLRNRPLSLPEAQEIDEHLGDVIDGLLEGGRLTKEGKKVLDIQTAFRHSIDNAKPSDILGGTEGFSSLKEGRLLWKSMAQLRDIEKVISRAEMMDNPATGIKTGFRTIVSNPARLRGYSPEVQKLMKSAAQTGMVGDTLRVLGSRLIPIASAATGNIPGALLGQAASSLARSGATELQLGRANKVAEAITKPLGFNQASNIIPPALPSAAVGGGINATRTIGVAPQGQPTQEFTYPMPSATQNVITREEDIRPYSYPDSRGFRTVGVGFNMEQPNAKAIWNRAGVKEDFDAVFKGKQPLSPESIDRLFKETEPAAQKAAKKLVKNYDELGDNQKVALTSLAFQLGAKGLGEFKRTLAYLSEGNSKAVENNLINSKMGREQSPARTRRTALMLAYNMSHEEADRLLAEQGRIKPTERKYT